MSLDPFNDVWVIRRRNKLLNTVRYLKFVPTVISRLDGSVCEMMIYYEKSNTIASTFSTDKIGGCPVVAFINDIIKDDGKELGQWSMTFYDYVFTPYFGIHGDDFLNSLRDI